MNTNIKRWVVAFCAVCAMLLSANVASAQTCGDTTWDLTAGQTIDVGSVMVNNDLDNIYVTYTLDYQDPDCPDGAVEAEFGVLSKQTFDQLATPKTYLVLVCGSAH